MCGIVGILARNGVVGPELLERATRSLAHRGPDDHGTVILRDNVPEPVEIGLGNRRLAILDLSPLGHQPMHDPATGNWIVHNGEIYNFRDVREKLEREGISFVSQSDTEVALKAYGQWGERCLEEFRGMFAFAIWDARRHRLFVARDPMGIKPLYYFSSADHFLFASEIRTLLGTGVVPGRIDPVGLSSYLTFGSVYEPATMIEGVSALASGSYLVWEQGSVREERYWDFESSRVEVPGDRVQLMAQMEKRLDESVQLQLVSDVPVGVFLSGGIDSSSLIGILSRHGIRPSTFSIVFKEEEFSEAKYSRAASERFQTDHHEILVSQRDFLEAIPSALGAMDQPTMDGVNTYFVSEQTRRAGVKVALSGLGGDELFGGYSSFRSVPRMERFAGAWQYAPGPLRAGVASMFQVLAPASDQNRKLAALLRENGRLLHPYFLSRMLFTPDVRDRMVQSQSEKSKQMQAPLERILGKTRDFDPINRVSYLESRCYMLNTLLRDSDVMSMAHGLEVRVPLIDHKLAESLMSMPGSWKLGASTPKPLLVGALRGALPEEIVHRPKLGFTLPFERWVRESLRAEIESALRKLSEGPLSGMLTADGPGRVWDDFVGGITSWSRPWSLFVLRRWAEMNL